MEDEDMPDAPESPPEEEQAPEESDQASLESTPALPQKKQEPELEPESSVSETRPTGQRRRGRRQVMKKKVSRDAEGYLGKFISRSTSFRCPLSIIKKLTRLLFPPQSPRRNQYGNPFQKTSPNPRKENRCHLHLQNRQRVVPNPVRVVSCRSLVRNSLLHGMLLCMYERKGNKPS